MAAVAMQVDLVESPPKPAEARKRQKRPASKTLTFEEPEAEAKPAVLRRKKGKQADPTRAAEAEADSASPEAQQKPPQPEPIDAEADVTPPPSRRLRNSNGKVQPIQLSFFKASESTGTQPPTPKPKAKTAAKGKKPPTEPTPGKNGQPAKTEVAEDEPSTSPPEPAAEKTDEALGKAEAKEDQRGKLVAAFNRAVPGLKHGQTVLLEEPPAPAVETAAASPDARPAKESMSKRKKKDKDEKAQPDAGSSSSKKKAPEAPQPADVEAPAPPATRPAKEAAPKRKKREEKAAQNSGSAAKEKPTQAVDAEKNAPPQSRKKREEKPPENLGSSDVKAAPAEAAAETVDVQAPPSTETRPDKKAATKRQKKEAKAAMEPCPGTSSSKDAEAVEAEGSAPPQPRNKREEKPPEDPGSSDVKAAPGEAVAEAVDVEAPPSTETRPDKKAAVKRRKKESKSAKEPCPGTSSSKDPEDPEATSESLRQPKAMPKRKKQGEAPAKEPSSLSKHAASGSPNGKLQAWRRFFRRKEPPAADGKVTVLDEEVIDVEAQKKRKFDWKAGFAKVQRPNKCPGLIVGGAPKAPPKEEKDLEIVESAAAASNAQQGQKKELPKPDKVLVDWAERHSPKTQKQLRPIKAWEQFRDWLKNWRPGGAKRQAALVVGPPGSGKSAGVRCLVRRLRGKFLEHDLEEPAGRNFIENMSKKQRDGRQMSDDLVFVCNLNEPPTPAAKEWLAQALQAARTPVIFVAGEGMINSKDTGLWKLCLEIRINLAEIFITRKLAEVSRLEERPLPEGLCEQVATTAPGDLRRALRMAQLLSVQSTTQTASTADDACFPEAALAPIAAAGQLLGSSAEALSLPKSLDLIALDESVAPLVRWGALSALGFFFPRPGARPALPPPTGSEMPKEAQEPETPAEATEDAEELEALQTCARISSLVAESDAAAGWLEAALEKAGTMPSEAAGSPASVEPLLLACLSSEARRYAGRQARKAPLQLKPALPDPVCPIPPDQIALLTRQLGVPKAWVENRVFEWIIATRANAPARTLKNFRTWAKRQADRYMARQGARETQQPSQVQAFEPEDAEMDASEPILLESEGPADGQAEDDADASEEPAGIEQSEATGGRTPAEGDVVGAEESAPSAEQSAGPAEVKPPSDGAEPPGTEPSCVTGAEIALAPPEGTGESELPEAGTEEKNGEGPSDARAADD